jgi:hypothetical protein
MDRIFILNQDPSFIIEWKEDNELITFFVVDGVFHSRLYFNLETGEDQRYKFFDGYYHCSSLFNGSQSRVEDEENILWTHEFVFLFTILQVKGMTNILSGFQFTG